MIPNHIPVLIEITDLQFAKRGNYKIGDIIIGGRALKGGILSNHVWVCFGSDDYDFDVFELGQSCRLWNNLSKSEAELISLPTQVTEWFEIVNRGIAFNPNILQYLKSLKKHFSL